MLLLASEALHKGGAEDDWPFLYFGSERLPDIVKKVPSYRLMCVTEDSLLSTTLKKPEDLSMMIPIGVLR